MFKEIKEKLKKKDKQSNQDNISNFGPRYRCGFAEWQNRRNKWMILKYGDKNKVKAMFRKPQSLSDKE